MGRLADAHALGRINMQRKLLPRVRSLLVIGASTGVGGSAAGAGARSCTVCANGGDRLFQRLLAEPRIDLGASGAAEPGVGGGLSPAESLGQDPTGRRPGPS